jgi:hypothetical protein
MWFFLLDMHDRLYWHCPMFWSQNINDFLLRRIKP